MTEALALSIENTRTSKLLTLLIAVFFLTLYVMPADCQFADLPQDAKTVDIGVNGDGASQTFSLTAVIPFHRINGWAGVFGSRLHSSVVIVDFPPPQYLHADQV